MALFFFLYATKQSIRDVAAVSVKKKTFEKEKLNLWQYFNLQKHLNLIAGKTLPYLLFSFTSAYYEFGVAHKRNSLKGLPFWD